MLCYNVFHFRDFWMYFWLDFLSRGLRSFSSIPSVGLGARTSLIIYLQPCSESMTLASSFCWILPFSPKPRFFEFIQNRKGNLWIWEKPILKHVPYVEVTLVSKFYPIWYLVP
jgi:hypothetical protein